jgi:hypothetical protein
MAEHVADHAFDRRALRDRHLGLRDGAMAGDLDGAAAEEMQDAHAARPAFVVDLDELFEAALKPRRHHAPFGVPDGTKAVPQPRVAIDGPGVHEFADDEFVGGGVGHCGSLHIIV